MTEQVSLTRRAIPTGCTVTVLHTEESLEAHVELDDGLLPESGDKITVYGDAVQVPYGESIRLRREATLVRGSVLDKIWVRILAWFDMTELYEVSFSTRRF